MRWKELESDIKPGNLAEALQHTDCLSALFAIINLMEGVRVYALRSCVDAILSHVGSDTRELGGLLLGRIYEVNMSTHNPADMLTIVTLSIPIAEYRNSPVSLLRGTEVWSRTNELASVGNIVVGWYHSHPNLGAFFSGTDRRTQQAFFNHHYSLGWVIDPFRNEQKVFCGRDSEEYQHPIVVIEHGLEMAQNL